MSVYILTIMNHEYCKDECYNSESTYFSLAKTRNIQVL